jgi:hypothetical protein
MRRIFCGFVQKLVPHESLTLPFEPFRFWLRMRGDIRIQKPLPAITHTESLLLNFFKRKLSVSSTPRTSDTVSHRLPVSLSQRVANSANHRYGESTTPRIVESRSRRIGDTGSRYSKKKLIWCQFPELLTAKPCL